MTRFRLLGPLDVQSGKGSIDPGQPRQRAVLAILLHDAGHLVTWETLANRLWDHEPPASARRSLYSHAARIRTVLREAFAGNDSVHGRLVRQPGGYVLEIDPELVDLHSFRRLTDRAQGAGLSDAARAALLEQALRLWAGEPFTGLPGTWFAQTRVSLRRRHLDAVLQWSDVQIALGTPDVTVSALAQLLEAHPYEEPLVVRLIRALAAAGQQAAALECFREARERLVADLGIEPGPGLQQIHHEVLNGEVPRSGTVSAVPTTWGLPSRKAQFTGRESELAAIAGLFGQEHRPAIVVLCGLKGIGKTALAIEYLHRHTAKNRIVVWIPATDRDGTEAALADFGRDAGIAGASPAELVRRTMTWLGGQRDWLLVFDGASPQAVRGLLPATGHGEVLITSRGRDWTDVGQLFEIQVMSEADAVTMLLSRSGDLSAEAHAAARLVSRRLGYLPLALEQAASYCRDTCTIATYHQLLDRHGTRLLSLAPHATSGSDDAPVELLSLLAWLAPGYFPQATITGNTELLPPALREAARDPVRWRDCLEQLRSAGWIRTEPALIWSHHLLQESQRWGSGTWKRLAFQLVAADFPVTWNDTRHWTHAELLLPHVESLLDDHPLEEALLSVLPDSVVAFHHARGEYDRAFLLSQAAFYSRRHVMGAEHPHTLRAMNHLALIMHRRGEYSHATELHARELDLSKLVLGLDNPGTLASMNNFARALDGQGKYTEAEDLHRQTLELRRRILGHDHPDTMTSLHNLANTRFRQQEYTDAEAYHRTTLHARHRVFGRSHVTTLQSLNNLANISHARQDYEEAEKRHREVLSCRQRLLGPDHPDTLISLNNLASSVHGLKNYTAARDMHLRVLEARLRIFGPHHPQTLTSMNNLAGALFALGALEPAYALRQQSYEGRRRVLGPSHPQTMSAIGTHSETPEPTPNNTEDTK